MDATDTRIVRLLRHDVRQPFAQLAEQLDLTTEEVEVRVRRMREDGEVALTAVTDPLRLGFTREALLGITVEPGRRDEVVAGLAALPEVHYLVSTTSGGFDVLCEVAGASDAHLLEILSQRVRPVAGVRGIQTYLYLSTEKMTFDYDG